MPTTMMAVRQRSSSGSESLLRFPASESVATSVVSACKDKPRSPGRATFKKDRTLALLLATVAGSLVGLLVHPCGRRFLFNATPVDDFALSGSHDSEQPVPNNENDSEQPEPNNEIAETITWNKPACTLPKFNTTKITLTCAPRVLIAGAMKCGTNEAGALIAKHPRVVFNLCGRNCTGPKQEEVWQGIVDPTAPGGTVLWESPPWYLNYPRRYKDYFKRFPVTDGVNNITIDKSPAFLKDPGLGEAVHRLMPDTRLVFTVCDPAERLVSEFFHHHREEELLRQFNIKFHTQNLTPPANIDEFASFVNLSHPQCGEDGRKNCEFVRDFFLDNGWYIRHIKKWWQYFDPQDTLVINMMDSPVENTKKMLRFAGLPLDEYPWDNLANEKAFMNTDVSGYTGRERAWAQYPNAMRVFSQHYAASNQELASSIGKNFPLQWKSTTSVSQTA